MTAPGRRAMVGRVGVGDHSEAAEADPDKREQGEAET